MRNLLINVGRELTRYERSWTVIESVICDSAYGLLAESEIDEILAIVLPIHERNHPVR